MKSLGQRCKALGNRLWPRRWHPFALAERQIRGAGRGRVVAGPFRGMHYVDASVCSGYLPKLLGTYEMELHGLIEEYCAAEYAVIINVGAAEGYYAAGMAFRCPRAKVHAFESLPKGRALIRQMAELNRLSERLTIEGTCTRENLAALLRQNPGALLIMDTEGAEADLLQPETMPELAAIRVLVETHDFIRAGLTAEIAARFAATHQIRRFDTRARTREDLPVRSRFLDRWLLKHTREFRPAAMTWLDLKPK